MRFKLGFNTYKNLGWFLCIFEPDRTYNHVGIYLHNDGQLRKSTKNDDTGMYSGYFEHAKDAIRLAQEHYKDCEIVCNNPINVF